MDFYHSSHVCNHLLQHTSLLLYSIIRNMYVVWDHCSWLPWNTLAFTNYQIPVQGTSRWRTVTQDSSKSLIKIYAVLVSKFMKRYNIKKYRTTKPRQSLAGGEWVSWFPLLIYRHPYTLRGPQVHWLPLFQMHHQVSGQTSMVIVAACYEHGRRMCRLVDVSRRTGTKDIYLHLNGCISISWLLTAAILPIWPHSIVSTVADSWKKFLSCFKAKNWVLFLNKWSGFCIINAAMSLAYENAEFALVN